MLLVPAGEFAPRVEVFAVGLFEGVAEGLELFSVLFLQLVDLSAQRRDEGAFAVRRRIPN